MHSCTINHRQQDYDYLVLLDHVIIFTTVIRNEEIAEIKWWDGWKKWGQGWVEGVLQERGSNQREKLEWKTVFFICSTGCLEWVFLCQIEYGYNTKPYIQLNSPEGRAEASFYRTHREGTEPSFALLTGPLPQWPQSTCWLAIITHKWLSSVPATNTHTYTHLLCQEARYHLLTRSLFCIPCFVSLPQNFSPNLFQSNPILSSASYIIR